MTFLKNGKKQQKESNSGEAFLKTASGQARPVQTLQFFCPHVLTKFFLSQHMLFRLSVLITIGIIWLEDFFAKILWILNLLFTLPSQKKQLQKTCLYS